MAPILVCLILVLCLLISVVKYTLALILKWSVPKAVVKKDYTYQPTVSVLMPCFNEGRRFTKLSKVSARAIIQTKNLK